MRSDTQQTPTISATGDVVLVRKPDLAFITLFIRAEGILLEDAVRESTHKVDQVNQTLRDTYREIREIQIKDLYVGEGRPALGLARANPPRPEVVKSLLVTIPPNPELAVKIVDMASRMGCLMGNPVGFPMGSPNPRSVILYGLAEPLEAEKEATARAIADAKEKAAQIAKIVEKRIGSIRNVGAMDLLSTDDLIRRSKNPILARSSYLSVSVEGVEISAKVRVTFELMD
jgi:uncharacterized protein YggE